MVQKMTMCAYIIILNLEVFLIANKSTKDIKIILFTSNKKHLKVHSHNASAYTIYVKEHKVPNSNGESSKEGY